jgi:hypothetical protein
MDEVSDEDMTREWAGKDPKLIAWRVATITHNVNDDLGPLGPMNRYRMAEVILHEGLQQILEENHETKQ